MSKTIEKPNAEAVDLRRLVRRFCVLAHIPNQEGFRFIGRDHAGELIPCIVKKDPVGCYGAYDERNGSPCFMRLEAWSEYSANDQVELPPNGDSESRSIAVGG